MDALICGRFGLTGDEQGSIRGHLLRKFLKDRKLELNVEKPKVLIFNRGRNEKKARWKWKDKELKKVRSFKYLEFVLNRNGDYKEHVKDLCSKDRVADNKVWCLVERISKNDYERRWMLFNYLVRRVMTYGVEVWGKRERN